MRKISDFINTSSKRLEDETFEEYKERRKKLKEVYSFLKKGKTIWQPNFPITRDDGTSFPAGPYVKKVHGDMTDNINKAIEGLENNDEDVGSD